jgi:hypothetical protein
MVSTILAPKQVVTVGRGFLTLFVGKFLAIECKAGKGRCTALQIRELEKIKFAGGEALIINEKNLDEVEKCLTSSRMRKKTRMKKPSSS